MLPTVDISGLPHTETIELSVGRGRSSPPFHRDSNSALANAASQILCTKRTDELFPQFRREARKAGMIGNAEGCHLNRLAAR
jgi:hypothetical protein